MAAFFDLLTVMSTTSANRETTSTNAGPARTDMSTFCCNVKPSEMRPSAWLSKPELMFYSSMTKKADGSPNLREFDVWDCPRLSSPQNSRG